MDNGTIRVLLVEDDPDDYILTSELLAETTGTRIKLDWARDFDAGLKAIKGCAHDAYLLDYQLGKRDGLELLRDALASGCKGPLILLTGAGDRELSSRALELGAADFLVKGQLDSANLERTIRYALRQSRYTEELQQRVQERTAALEKANRSLKEIVAELSVVNEKMRSSEERFRLALSGGAVTVYEQDSDFRYKWVYPQAPYRSDVVGKTDEELSPGSGAAARADLKRKVLETGTPARGEVSAVVKGVERWYDLNIEARRDSHGKIVGIGGTALDITARKQVEDSLGQQKRLLEALIESVLDGILIVSTDGEILHHNQQFLDIWNFPAEVVESKSDEMALKWAAEQTSDPAGFLSRITEIYSHPDTKLREEIRMKDGRVYERFGAPVLSGTTRLGWVWTFRDISERKRAEEDLRQSQVQLQLVTDSMPVLMAYVNSELKFNFVNKTYQEWFGHPQAEFIGRHVRDVLGESAYEAVRPAMERALSGEAFNFERRMPYKDSGSRFIAASYLPDIDESGVVKGFYALIEDITERKNSEYTILESEKRMRVAMNAANMYSWEIDVETRKTIISDDAARVLGFERDAGSTDVSLQIGKIIHPDDRARLGEALDRAYLTGELHEEMRFIAPQTGQTIWAETRATANRDADGKVVKLFGVTQNITPRKLSEEAIRESEEQLRTMADSIPQLAWMAEPDGYIFWYNRQWYDYTGTTPEEMKGWGWQSVHDPEMLPKVVVEWATALKKGTRFEMEFPLRRTDGSFRWFLTLVNPLCDSEGNIVRWFGTNTDIDESRQAQQALRDSEHRFQLLANNISQLAWTMHPDGQIYWFNQRWFDYTGTNPDEMQGWGWTKVLDPEDVDRVLENFKRDVAAGEVWEDTFTIRSVDGEHRWFLSRAVPVLDSEQKIVQWFGTNTDISDSKRADEVVRDRNEHLELLAQTGQKLILEDETDTAALQSIFERVCETVDSELCFNYLVGDEPETLHLEASVGLSKQERETFATIRFGEYLCGKVAASREPMVITDMQACAAPGAEALCSSGVKCYLGLPLLAHGHLFGTVAFATRKRDCISPGEMLSIQTIVDQVAATLARARATTALRESENRFELLANRNREILESIADGFYALDKDWRFTYVNPQAELFLNEEPGSLNGKVIWDAYPGLAGTEFERSYRRVAEDGVVVTFTAFYADHQHWYEVNAYPAQGGITVYFRDVTTRVAADAALRKSEERRHLAQNAGNVGVWDWDIVQDHTYWSDTMWKMYGLEKREINPDDSFWSSHLHASDRERVRMNMQSVVSSPSKEFRDEFRIVLPDGSVRWIESMAQVSRDENGRSIRMYGVNLDITDRKEIEERVKLSENQLRLVTNAVPALISYVDSSERFRFVNQRFHDWFGIAPEDLVGSRVKDVLGSSAYQVLKPKIDEALSGQQVTFETALTYRAAGPRYVHISYMPDIGMDGTVYGYYGLTNDLTELKRSQDLLLSTEERMALMVESLADYAIFSIDSEGRIDSWNNGAELIFGYSSVEILGRPYEVLYTSEDILRGIPAKEMKVARLKGRASDDRWHNRKDGSRFYSNGVMTPLYVGKELTGYAKIASDLTEKQRRAEELQRAHDELDLRVKERTRELAESNLALLQEMEVREVAEKQRVELLGRLISGQEVERRRIARDLHDQLGQRLTALRLKMASLRELSSGHNEIESRVERLQEIGEKLDSEVSFLAWELRPTALDDLGLVDAVGAFVNEWSKHYEIAADFHSRGLFKDRLDHESETHLYRITQEALNNIIKHAKASFVNVLLEKRNEDVILIIEDNGAGFDVKAVQSSSDANMGQGLVGMRERAALVGGNFEVETGKGKGTTIYVRVPI